MCYNNNDNKIGRYICMSVSNVYITDNDIILDFGGYQNYSKISNSIAWDQFRRNTKIQYNNKTTHWVISKYTMETLNYVLQYIENGKLGIHFEVVDKRTKIVSDIDLYRSRISPKVDLSLSYDTYHDLEEYSFLKSFQIDAVNKILTTLEEFDGGFLFLETGLGKTVCAAVVADIYLKNGYTVIFITNKSLLGQTAKSIEQFVNIPSNIINGTTYFNATIGGNELFIINYETFIRLDEYLEKDGKFLLILDEASKLKNYQTNLYKKMKKIINKINPKILIMTATPFENNLGEFFSILQVGFKFRLNQKEFINKFAVTKIIYNSSLGRELITIDYYKNHELFNNIFSNVWVRYKKADVVTELPVKHEIIKLVKADIVQFNIIDYVERILPDYTHDMLSDLSTSQIYNLMGMLLRIIATEPNALKNSNSKILEYGKNSGYGSVEELIPQNYVSPKMKELINILKDIDLNNERVIIFSTWTNVLDIIKSTILSHWNIDIFEITGDTTNRYNVIKMFNNRKNGILLCSDAGAHGIDLPGVNYVIEYDIPWNPAIREQRMNRIYRMTSTTEKYLIDIVSTLEENVYNLVITKKINFDKSLDGADSEYIKYSDLVKIMTNDMSKVNHPPLNISGGLQKNKLG